MTSLPSQTQDPIPSLPCIPLVGNLFALRNDRLALLQRISETFGDIGAFHFGPRLVPLVNAPELVRQVLVDHHAIFQKTATVRALATPVLGNSIFLSEGEEHRRQRRLLTPLFHPTRIVQYAEVVTTLARRLQDTWEDGSVIDLAEEMRGLTLSIISAVLFDADVLGKERDLGAALTSAFHHFVDSLTNPLRLPLSWPTPGNRRRRRALDLVNTTIDRLIDERRRTTTDRGDILSPLVHPHAEDAFAPLHTQQARHQLLSLFVAGHETVAVALTWCWYLLSQHPEIATRMWEEGDHVLAGRVPTENDLPHLPYTLQVFKETMRLYPPVYAFTRGATAPVRLGTYVIPQGTSVVISPYTLHRRARYFPDPERFDPERFSPEQEQQRERYAYIPFGAGPHICLGMHFAMLEGHLVLATLAQGCTFEFVGTRPVEPEPMVILRPKGKVLMRVHRR